MIYDIKPHGWLLQVGLHSRCDPCILLHSFAKHLERIGGGEAPVDLSGCSAWQMETVLYMKNHEDMIGRANNIYTTFDPIHTVSLGTGPRFKIRASSGYMEAKAKKSAFAQMMMHLDQVYYSNYHSFENLFWAKHFRSQRYF